ncbi:MAG TPA: MlaD family protein [Steroidobacteraceae bacterium]|jgi:paraquat-inducible protein B|nr:MlaD family protein [Steroidobacteraceae bacterium]
MADNDQNVSNAILRPRRWFSWVWVAPLGAAAIVIGLAIRGLEDRGPLVTISFTEAEGLQPGETKIRHKDVELGTVERVYLTRDMSRVMVEARMRRSVTEHLNEGSRFWIVRPRVGIGGISGLSTLVSGAYIEMYPGDGPSERNFVGLDEPPTLQPDAPGHSFTLRAADLGQVVEGSPVDYRGVPVGEVEGFALDPSSKQIEIYAFVRAPYEHLVHPETRFWNSGGVDVSIGPQGLRFRAESWQQLLSGGVSFDTPDTALEGTPSPEGSVFRLYANQSDAYEDPRGPTVVYRAIFRGASGNLGPGSAVELQGVEVGQVISAQLQYDDISGLPQVLTTLQVDPGRIQIVHPQGDSHATATDALRARIAKLVTHGLRAELITASFITGNKVVSLDIHKDAPAAKIELVDGLPQLPSVSGSDLTQILANVKSVLHHIDAATEGPELGHAIRELDRTLTNLDQLTHEVQPQIQPLLQSLHDTAEATQRTLQSADRMLGGRASSNGDLGHLLRELTDAARSLRALTDYIDRHPESLIRGRQGETP